MSVTLEEFSVNPEADEFHARGKNLAYHGDFVDALNCLGLAIELLSDDTVPDLLQSMCIQRDHGFTVVRIGIKTGNLSLVGTGIKTIDNSRTEHLRAISEMTADSDLPIAHWRLDVEAGKSLNAAARALTAKFVMVDANEHIPREEVEEVAELGSKKYAETTELLTNAGNRDYRISHAKTHARHLYITTGGSGLEGVRTARRLVREVKASGDAPNGARDASDTFGPRLSDLITVERARASVLKQP